MSNPINLEQRNTTESFILKSSLDHSQHDSSPISLQLSRIEEENPPIHENTTFLKEHGSKIAALAIAVFAAALLYRKYHPANNTPQYHVTGTKTTKISFDGLNN